MVCNVDLLFTDTSIFPSTFVSRGIAITSLAILGILFMNVTTVWTLFVGVTYGLDVATSMHEMASVAVNKFSVTQLA